MKTPNERRAAILRRASTWSDLVAADRLRQLAAETETIRECAPVIHHA